MTVDALRLRTPPDSLKNLVMGMAHVIDFFDYKLQHATRQAERQRKLVRIGTGDRRSLDEAIYERRRFFDYYLSHESNRFEDGEL